jgi:hypothetical protein
MGSDLWRRGELSTAFTFRRLTLARIFALPMVDRFKRAAIALGIFLVLSSGTALAQEQLTKADLTQLVVTLGVRQLRQSL